MRRLLSRGKEQPAAPEPLATPSPPPPPPPGVKIRPELRALVVTDDPIAVEGGRDIVTDADLDALVIAYWTTDDWEHRLNIVELTQDRSSGSLTVLAADFLRAPIAPGDERGELGKAIALMHVGQELDHLTDEPFSQYMNYYNDRRLLARRVAEALDLLGFEAVPVPPQVADPVRPDPVDIRLDGPADRRLLDAIAIGCRPEFDRALADRADVDATITSGDFDTCTALIRACMTEQYDMAAELVARGANVRALRTGPNPDERDKGQTALWWAANHGNDDFIDVLVAAGADPDQPDSWGSTPLHQAAGGGHLSTALKLLALGADELAPIYDGRTPFNMASTHNRTEIVKLFLDLDHPPDQTGSAGYTALMTACEEGNQELAAALIEAGADVNARHPGPGIYAGLRGWTPLVFCVRGGRIKITQQLLAAGAEPDAVITPEDEGRVEQRVIHFCHGRQTERLQEILVQAGARPG